MKEKMVYKIFSNENNVQCGTYSQGNYTKYEFDSPEDARLSNCHGIYKDGKKYRIAKYRVVYELIEDNCDKGATYEEEYLISFCKKCDTEMDVRTCPKCGTKTMLKENPRYEIERANNNK